MDREAAILLLESTHSFPSNHPFHVIVRSDEAVIAEVSASIAALLGLEDLREHTVRVPSKQGTYTSLRLSLPCGSAAVVLDIYAHLTALPAVIRYF